MEKYVLIFFFLSTGTFSQERASEFILTPDGFVDYVVVDFDTISASQIFTNLRKWAEYHIRDAKESNYSEVENEFLSYTFWIKGAINTWEKKRNYVWDIWYDVELRIKGTRLRVDLEIMKMPNVDEEHGLDLTIRSGITSIYKKDGKQRKYQYTAEAITKIEESANKLVESFSNAVLGKPDNKNDDW